MTAAIIPFPCRRLTEPDRLRIGDRVLVGGREGTFERILASGNLVVATANGRIVVRPSLVRAIAAPGGAAS